MTATPEGGGGLPPTSKSAAGPFAISFTQRALLPFPFILYDMLEQMETLECEDILSWHSDGSCFKVHQPDAFMKQISPLFFKQQSRYKSFKRQLNLYGFRVNKTGFHKGT